MAGHEKELLEALTSSRILTSMITPAVLISACGTLIFSTSARLGRIFDRVNVMKGEVEAIITGKISHPVERMVHLRGQIDLQRRRARLIQKAMAALYTATLLFVAASLAIAVNVAYGSDNQAWIPTLLGGTALRKPLQSPLRPPLDRFHRIPRTKGGGAEQVILEKLVHEKHEKHELNQ